MHGRVETTPKQQLAELRQAYERYAALAEQLKDSIDSTIDPELQRALVRDACRIAAAYKKSVTNSCARIEDVRPSEGEATRFALLAMRLTVIVAIIAGGALTVTFRPELLRPFLPVATEPAITPNSAVARREITPIVAAEEKPILSAPAPERAGTALGPVQAADGRESVVKARSAIAESQITVQSTAHKKPATHLRRSPIPSGSTEAVPPVSARSASAAPGVADSEARSAASIASTSMAAMSTQPLPTYPTDTNRSVELGITHVQVSISAAGAITDCRVVGTSGSPRLDASACSMVQRNWQLPPPMRNSQPTSGMTNVSVVWDLGAAK
jgi:TonB family protein